MLWLATKGATLSASHDRPSCGAACLLGNTCSAVSTYDHRHVDTQTEPRRSDFLCIHRLPRRPFLAASLCLSRVGNGLFLFILDARPYQRHSRLGRYLGNLRPPVAAL